MFRRKTIKFRDISRQKWYKQNLIVILILFCVIASMSVGYAILNQVLGVQGDVIVKAVDDIRILSIESNPGASCGFDNFNPTHTMDSVTVNFELPHLNCTMEYKVTIRNDLDLVMQLFNIVQESYNNSDIIFELSGVSINNSVNPGETVEMIIIFKYNPTLTSLPSNRTLGAILQLAWREFLDVPVCDANNANLLRCRLLADNGGQSAIDSKARPNFGSVSSTNDGMFSEDDGYTHRSNQKSYYYRGAVTNNNLIFAEHQWKIIRIEGSGVIRLLYNGPCPENSCTINNGGTNVFIPGGTTQWNASFRNDNKYAGFMYGGANGSPSTSFDNARLNQTNSNIKNVLDTWYTNNIANKGATNTNMISDTVHCNDRSLTSGPGFGNTNSVNTGFTRLLTSFSPSLSCANPSDRFSVSSHSGNSNLTNPVGLISADEAAFGGLVAMIPNANNYLNAGITYWSMTPSSFNDNNSRLWVLFSNGSINPNAWVDHNHNVRPVIALRANTLFQTGNGSAANPYLIGEAIRVEGTLSQSVYLQNQNTDVKSRITMTKRINGVPSTIPPSEYEVVGFNTSALGNHTFIARYLDFDVTFNYEVRTAQWWPLGGATSTNFTGYQVTPTQINLSLSWNGQLANCWSVHSTNILDMYRPIAQQVPRVNCQGTGGTGTANNRFINAPRNPQGQMLSGYYFVFAERNGNADSAVIIIYVP